MTGFTNGEYGLTFTKVNYIQDKFETLLTVRIGVNKKDAVIVFNKIKNNYSEVKDSPEIILDFINSEWEIEDDYAITHMDAINLAESMGFKLPLYDIYGQ